jgi:DNA polymerase-4
MACPTNCEAVGVDSPTSTSHTRSVIFNLNVPNIMHIDLNSCFASVEQQANPLLRGKPLAVAAYDAPYGAILAPSVEAKLYGIKTGMSVREGRELCPFLVMREPDPPKYRQVHKQIGDLLNEYSDHVVSKSIDEYCLTLRGGYGEECLDLQQIAQEIKSRIKSEIGDHLRVSIGVSTNQILAKLASGLHKPDGFDILDKNNYLDIYKTIKLQDFCGINKRNETRLNRVGIFTATQFFQADIQTLKSAFESVLGRYWYTRLRGYEIDDVTFRRRSYGQSYVLPRPMDITEWRPILAKLIAKAARRLRAAGYYSTGIGLSLHFGDKSRWHTAHQGSSAIHDDANLLSFALSLYERNSPKKMVKKVAVTCFGLEIDSGQLSCLVDTVKQKSLVKSLDELNNKWGEYSVSYGSFLGSKGHVKDSIAFGK